MPLKYYKRLVPTQESRFLQALTLLVTLLLFRIGICFEPRRNTFVTTGHAFHNIALRYGTHKLDRC